MCRDTCSDYNRSHVLTPSRKGYVNQSLRLHSNQKSLKHLTRARKLEDEDEKEKDEEKVHYAGEDDDTEDYPVEEEDKDECRAEEAVLKLYTDIKDRNINGISEVIGDECQCFCNLLSSYRLLQGKKVKENILRFAAMNLIERFLFFFFCKCAMVVFLIAASDGFLLLVDDEPGERYQDYC